MSDTINTFEPALDKKVEISYDSLPNSTFEDVNLGSATFCNVNLKEAKFNDVNMDSAEFDDVSMRGANFTDIYMVDSKFLGVNLSNTRFGCSIMNNVEFKNPISWTAAFFITLAAICLLWSTNLIIALCHFFRNR